MFIAFAYILVIAVFDQVFYFLFIIISFMRTVSV